MPSLARVVMMLCVSVLFIVTGCSASQPQPAPSTACVADTCDGQEPTAIKCDADAVSIATVDDVVVGKIKGKLEIRKAKPANCDRIYWGRFAPYEGTTGPWELTFQRNDKQRTVVQKSEPGNPLVEGYTVVLHAALGAEVQACIKDATSGREVCTDKINPS
jgi:hypothetical protein